MQNNNHTSNLNKSTMLKKELITNYFNYKDTFDNLLKHSKYKKQIYDILNTKEYKQIIYDKLVRRLNMLCDSLDYYHNNYLEYNNTTPFTEREKNIRFALYNFSNYYKNIVKGKRDEFINLGCGNLNTEPLEKFAEMNEFIASIKKEEYNIARGIATYKKDTLEP